MNVRTTTALTAVILLTAAGCGSSSGDAEPADEPVATADVGAETEAPSDETAPDETEPAESEPAESEPAESEPAESEPTQTTETDPVDSGTAAGECGLASGEKAVGDPIVVGAIVGETGPADFSSAADAADAYFDCVNANGGINGRPIDYRVTDDKWDPEVAVAAARGLVEDDEVVAMIGSTSFVECASNAGYYEEQEVLVLAGVGVPRECFFSSNIAPVNQGPRLSAIGVAQYAVDQGAESLACISNIIPNFGAWVCEGMTAYGESVGVEVVSFNGQPDGSDAETIALQAIEADTDAVVVAEPGPLAVAYLGISEAQADDTPWYSATSVYDTSTPDALGDYWVDRLIVQIELAELDSTGPDNLLWQSVMEDFAEADDPRDTFSQAGFLSAKIFVDALLELDPASIDRSTVSDAMRAIDGYETDMICGDWYFGDGDRHHPNHAGRIVQLVDVGIGFTTLEDCTEVADPELADILDNEG